MSQKGLTGAHDAKLVKMALLQNQQLRVLKLGYNQLGDDGLQVLVPGIAQHRYLERLDLGFNNIGDIGCCALAQAMVVQQQQQQQQQAVVAAAAAASSSNNNNAVVAGGGCRLSTLYLAGNCIGPDGALALADVITSRKSSSSSSSSKRQHHHLLLQADKVELDKADLSKNACCSLKRLYLTGNRLGPDGVKAITDAIMEEGATAVPVEMDTTTAAATATTFTSTSNTDEMASSKDGDDVAMDTFSTAEPLSEGMMEAASAGDNTKASTSPEPSSASQIGPNNNYGRRGMEELFLGGTGLGSTGCQAVARLLASRHCHLQVLSLANCEISDEEITRQDFGLASALKANRDALPLASLQLSFNSISHKGLEALMNGLWGSKTLRELRLDNNDIGDRGAQQLAAILPYLKTLESLDVGFNNINNKSQGMKILMKAVAEANNLTTLSLSGNPMQDVSSAKAVAYALAYNTSLQSLLLVHCQLTTEGQRHVAAGAVSNSRTSLRDLSGFPVGRKLHYCLCRSCRCLCRLVRPNIVSFFNM